MALFCGSSASKQTRYHVTRTKYPSCNIQEDLLSSTQQATMYLSRRQLAAGQPGKAEGVWVSGPMRTQEATSKALARHKQRALFHLLQAPVLHAPLPAHREETTHDPPRRRGEIRPVTSPSKEKSSTATIAASKRPYYGDSPRQDSQRDKTH